MQDSRFYSLVLHRLPDLGAVTYHRLVELFGSPEQVLAQPFARLESLVKPSTLSVLSDFQSHSETSIIGRQALADLDWLASQPQISLLALEDEAYPELLRQIPNPPPLLFVRGNPVALGLPQLGIVGSRNPSSGGRENALSFAKHMAASGFAVTSGLALGVDAAAHEGALAVSGITVAVMGTGIDLVYPSRHRALAQAIVDTGGALVSELPLGAGSKAAHFPQRNRIISGLSWGVLVVEAAIQSGSLITARTALQQNREVFAIPGSIHNPLARGCHQLIRQGATLVETAQDIADQLQGMLQFERDRLDKKHKPAQGALFAEEPDLSSLNEGEQALMTAMGFDPTNIDELVERTGFSVGSLAAHLVGLEIKGFVQQTGASFQRR